MRVPHAPEAGSSSCTTLVGTRRACRQQPVHFPAGCKAPSLPLASSSRDIFAGPHCRQGPSWLQGMPRGPTWLAFHALDSPEPSWWQRCIDHVSGSARGPLPSLRELRLPTGISPRQVEPLLILAVPPLQCILGWVTQLTDGRAGKFAELDVELNGSDSVFVGIHELPSSSPSFRPHPRWVRFAWKSTFVQAVPAHADPGGHVGQRRTPPKFRVNQLRRH